MRSRDVSAKIQAVGSSKFLRPDVTVWCSEMTSRPFSNFVFNVITYKKKKVIVILYISLGPLDNSDLLCNGIINQEYRQRLF